MNTQLQINEVAKRAGVSIRTIRFYEQKGLLRPSSFTSGGIRLYSMKDVNRLRFIRRLVEFGLSLDEVKLCLGEITDEQTRGEKAAHTVQLLNLQKDKLAEERAKLDQLENDIDDSLAKVSRCVKCGVSPCPEECPSYGQIL